MGRRRARAAVTLVAAGFLGLPSASAQEGSAEERVAYPFRVADRSSTQIGVHEFSRYAQRGEWALAVDQLQRLLDTPPEQGVVVRVAASDTPRYEGVFRYATRLFEGLPPEGRAAWETLVRPQAEALLERGLRRRREQDLHDAARRYPARDVRRRAFDALAHLALARGDFAAAAFHLSDLLSVAEEEERPQVLARLMFARAWGGDREGVERAAQLATDVLDRPVPGPAGTEPLRRFRDRMLDVAGPAIAAQTGWRQFGGNARGTGIAEVPPSPGPPRWAAGTGFARGRENDDSGWIPEDDDRHRSRPVFPVVAQGMVFVNNGLEVVAANVSSGNEVWRHTAPIDDPAEWRDNLVVAHTAAVADGTVYAPLAMKAVAPGAVSERRFYGKIIVYRLPQRSLVALDARTGEVVWSHESARLEESRPDAAAIREESVASPPLVVGDDLLVATFVYHGAYDVRLVCFDRRTGATRWRTSLAQGQQELNLFGRPVKELATGALAEMYGRVYLTTGLGIAAAVDRADGRVAWLSAYPQSEIPRAYHWYETKDREVSWWPSPLTATHGAIVAAPSDSGHLLAWDPDTGEERWRRAHWDSAHKYHWYLGVANHRAYVLGTRLAAFDVRTGKSVWGGEAGRIALPRVPSASAVGAGVLTPSRVFVPTATAVVEMDALTGAVEGFAALPLPERGAAPRSGNLVSGDGALLVVTGSTIEAHYSYEDLRDRLLKRMAEHADDPQLRLDAGEIFRAAGRLDEAVSSLETGLSLLEGMGPRTRERFEGPIRTALFESYTARATSRRQGGDAVGALADLRLAVERARDRGQAVWALFDLAELAGETGRVADAEQALRRVAREYGDVVTDTRGRPRAHAGALAAYQLGELELKSGRAADAVATWIDLLERHGDADLGNQDVRSQVRERLELLAKTQEGVVRGAVRKRARAALDAAKAAGDVAGLDRVARLYPDPEVAGEAALLAADMHLRDGRPREAAGVLRSLLLARQPAGIAAGALWRLARAYRELGETAKERAILRRVIQEVPQEPLDGGTKAKELAERELLDPRFRGIRETLPDPRPPLRLLWEAQGGEDLAPQVLVVRGERIRELEGKLLVARSRTLELLDGATGQRVWQVPLEVEQRAVFAAPGVLVVVGDDTRSQGHPAIVEGLDPRTGESLWTRRLEGRLRASEANVDVLHVLHQDSAPPRPHLLSAIALKNGEVLEQRQLPASMQQVVLVAEDAVIVVETVRSASTPPRTAVVLDSATYALRGRRDLTTLSSQFQVHAPLTSVVATTDGADRIVAIDGSTGDWAWPPIRLPGRRVKAIHGVPGAFVVSDDANQVRLIDASTGEERWRADLAAAGALSYQGESAEGDLVVATVKSPPGPRTSATAIALDARTGEERWRVPLPLAEASTLPHPVVCASVVVYELNERISNGEYRSRLVLLDRADGRVAQEIQHPRLGATYQRVIYSGAFLVLGNANDLAVYGR